ncbi:replication initiation protein [Pelomonas sp. V22]|uniref:replication initiation protein n=1 Tax=Pelomonas sp. V22 TaxID=2822139 RepID=UPI0024A7EA9E|nr:replication initiation protein [Pelomonas sp. V22]MDI4635898.1 replication initiation protein [Pelomonas sp. V22]
MDVIATQSLSPPELATGEGAELRKPHEMIVMVPRSKRVTLTGRRIYNALMQVSQARLAAMDTMPAADYMFEAPLPAILRTTGSSGEDRTAAKRYLKEMRGLEVDWESTAPGDGVKWRGFSMLSEVAIEVRNGENWVSWSYPPTIMAALREPKRWARIDLDVLASLGTYAAVALYEICARYRDNPGGVTSRKPVAWWADALSQVPAGTERREWRKFKNERLKSAIDEINSETDLEIELIEHKQGRAVVEVQFAVRRKRVAPKLRQASDVVDANLVLRAESLGIRELKLEGLIKEFSEDAVRVNIEVLEKRAANNKLREVDNAYSYLRSLLRNGGLDANDPPVKKGSRDVESELRDETISASELTAAQAYAARAEAAVPVAEWVNARMASIREELLSLSPERRQIFVDAAIEELTGKGMMTAVISRRVAQGDVLHGMVGAVVLGHYARAVYGPDWDKPDTEDMFGMRSANAP